MSTKNNLEERRKEGARLLKSALSHSEVARRLGVSRQAVSRWARRLAEVGGAIELLGARRPGRARRLDDAQYERLSALLRDGAVRAGFKTEGWSIKRVRLLIERSFGVEYSNSGCWELLKRLGHAKPLRELRVGATPDAQLTPWPSGPAGDDASDTGPYCATQDADVSVA
jgi:putative transposase